MIVARETLEIKLRPVRRLPDIEAMRRVRNECRAYMTRSTEEITPEQQATWWASLTAGDPHFETWKPNLLQHNDVLIGYGIVWHGERIASKRFPESHDAWWLTGGILSRHRGAGYGRHLFKRLIELGAGESCWLEVRADNVRARALYDSLGFKTVGLESQVAGTGVVVITMQRTSP